MEVMRGNDVLQSDSIDTGTLYQAACIEIALTGGKPDLILSSYVLYYIRLTFKYVKDIDNTRGIQ